MAAMAMKGMVAMRMRMRDSATAPRRKPRSCAAASSRNPVRKSRLSKNTVMLATMAMPASTATIAAGRPLGSVPATKRMTESTRIGTNRDEDVYAASAAAAPAAEIPVKATIPRIVAGVIAT